MKAIIELLEVSVALADEYDFRDTSAIRTDMKVYQLRAILTALKAGQEYVEACRVLDSDEPVPMKGLRAVDAHNRLVAAYEPNV
jgi:hypothetical protein